MTREQLKSIYLEWVNNYITIECYADHHGLHISEADTLIKLARNVYNVDHPDN